MKKLLIISMLFLVSFPNKIYSQDTNTIKYLPLKIGNSWTYYFGYGSPMGGGSGYDKYTVTNSFLSNGKLYYSIVLTRRIISGYPCTSRLFSDAASLRIDSFSCNIYKNATDSCLIDSLKSKLRDTATVCAGFQGNRSRCSDTSSIIIFGSSRPSKSFYISAFEGYNSQVYVKGIGLYSYHFGQLSSYCSINLRGCVINGIVYGDTSLTGINKISSEVPENFLLSQNYPNPFNPKSKIKFQISKLSEAKLVVYDILGKEVQTLVNEELSPGTYEVDFDGSNLPSGVYYYTLTAGDYKETKRMVLIK